MGGRGGLGGVVAATVEGTPWHRAAECQSARCGRKRTRARREGTWFQIGSEDGMGRGREQREKVAGEEEEVSTVGGREGGWWERRDPLALLGDGVA